ncbi:hypothetical protein B0H14DRAFT_2584457 [Mycena olivaceomarginata]|nr:hypothetical protein B0H14DRAFT_2584457 [Mycena olivaceomarginata]
MVSFKLLFTLCAATLALAAPVRRTVAEIEADILALTFDLGTLANMVNVFPNSGGSPADALAIADAVGLQQDLENADDDTVVTGPLDAADGGSIIGLLNNINVDAWLEAMEALTVKEPALAATGIAPGEIFSNVDLISSSLRHAGEDLGNWFNDLKSNLPVRPLHPNHGDSS